ncbi:MAG: acetate uptake transporter [Deltaproteobacteria bacterium]|nr:acetate uptake transporter [Deltaproteobacteria bacterium]MBW2071959.1 acetate uptake transporter [Deltaproteobacteria bacterium]
MAETKLGNPAVVGLGGFGMTTLILQFHNLGWVEIGPVLWLGFLFGGTAQLIAGMLEFKTGNNFGFCAFSGYGAFWISLCFYVVFGTSPEIVKIYPALKLTATGLGTFLLVWTFFTFILFIASLRHHTLLILIFLTLLLGFIGLDLKELAGNKAIGTLAAWDLIVCALLAWYGMAVGVYGEVGIKLPVGGPWIKGSAE